MNDRAADEVRQLLVRAIEILQPYALSGGHKKCQDPSRTYLSRAEQQLDRQRMKSRSNSSSRGISDAQRIS
jgi:hypothetical protein